MSTPNGKKVQILLEELKELYGIDCNPPQFALVAAGNTDESIVTTTLINISTNEQKKDWFLKLNPNGI
jgi:glutathione S-transferase